MKLRSARSKSGKDKENGSYEGESGGKGEEARIEWVHYLMVNCFGDRFCFANV